METEFDEYPEPVPEGSQLAALPFLSAVSGYLCGQGEPSGLRVTLHRKMSREGSQYLQQICAYIGCNGMEAPDKVGRTFAVSTGLMGKAFKTHHIWRTKKYEDIERLYEDLRRDRGDVGEKPEIDKVAKSFLAIPFLDSNAEVVLILYADCHTPNFFADSDRIHSIANMCYGFCKLFDGLETANLPRLRNFPFEPGEPVELAPTGYERIQEEIRDPFPPRFKLVTSFNYEAADI